MYKSNQKKRHHLDIILDDILLEIVSERAMKLGISKSMYARRCIELEIQSSFGIDNDVKERQRKHLMLLNNIANNVNQIARASNKVAKEFSGNSIKAESLLKHIHYQLSAILKLTIKE